MTRIEEPYRTPPGSLDAPFIYVYDASQLTDAQSYQDIGLPIQGDSDFVLRAIRGVDTVLFPAPIGRFDYKNPSGSYTAAAGLFGGASLAGLYLPRNWPVVPEKMYKANTQIRFDLYNVLRAANQCLAFAPIYVSQIAFCGVKRFPFQQGYARGETDYAYREMQYLYSLDYRLLHGYWSPFGPQPNLPDRVTQPMEQYDFELQKISISLAAGAAGALATTDLQIMLYDASMHQLSDKPLNQGFINSGNVAADQAPQYQAVYPVPPIVYPKGSAITLDIYSMVCNSDPRFRQPNNGILYNIVFQGLWRVPVNRYDR